MVSKIKKTLFLLIVSASACSSLVIDPSMNAVEAGDMTLAVQACSGPMYSGFGICRVKEGTKIESSWYIVLPQVSGPVLGGEVTVRMRDIVKSYAIPESGILEVPMADLFGSRVWEKSDQSIANATAKMRVKFKEGLEGVVQAEGQVLVRVLSNGYDPMPLDSGFQTWGQKCEIQYSTSGRGAVTCK